MSPWFPLPLFPTGVLSHSVITTVWVGVFVVCILNLRFGWALTGIVIPGYLVPLMISKPWSALVVILEGMLAYGVVWFLSRRLSKWGRWHNLFGRDRFFALILSSLIIRILMDAWLLPLIGTWLHDRFGITFDVAGQLRSFGLIITALIANYFWKPGLRRGLKPFLAINGLTFLLVRFGLMVLTNFNIGRTEYMYEDLATHFLASPKAYIIIIVTSFVASRMMVEYGWEFSGIMIPSLLALQWYQPLKLFLTLFESLVILGVGSLLLRTRLFSRISMEGARKLIFFFNIGFAYKFILASVLLHVAPYARVSDYFAFGYLLSTLVAIKMHQKSIVPHMVRSILQTSLVSVVVANLIGYGLTFVSRPLASAAMPMVGSATMPSPAEGNLSERLAAEKLRLYSSRETKHVRMPGPFETDAFASAMRTLSRLPETTSRTADVAQAKALLAGLHFRLVVIQTRYLVISETDSGRGAGIYIIDMQAPAEAVIVEVPAPLDEWLTVEGGLYFFLEMKGKALAIAGTARRDFWDRSGDVLGNPQTYFHVFHRVFGPQNVLQIRGHNRDSTRQLARTTPQGTPLDPEWAPSALWITRSLPPGMSLKSLQQACPDLRTLWQEPPVLNVQRQLAQEGFAELVLNRSALRHAMVRTLMHDSKIAPEPHVERIDGYLQSWLLETKGEIAERGSGQYRAPRLEEMLYLDQEVLTPLLSICERSYRQGRFDARGQETLQAIRVAAGQVGMNLFWYHHLESKQDFLILADQAPSSKRRYGGTYVFRLGKSEPLVVQIPRPLFERNSFEYGVRLFERTRATALLIAGAHPFANPDHSSDLIHIANKASTFNTVHQVLLRQAGNRPLLVVSCRAFSRKPGQEDPGADVFLADGQGRNTPTQLSLPVRQLAAILQSDGLRMHLVDGSRTTRGYEVGMQAQYQYLAQTQHKEFAVLWLSSALRERMRPAAENPSEEDIFSMCGIASKKLELRSIVEKYPASSRPLPRPMLDQVERFLKQRDALELWGLVHEWPEYRFSRLVDDVTGDAFLCIATDNEQWVALVHLTPWAWERVVWPSDNERDKTWQRFSQSRHAWLLARSLP